jgi:hypothetical protein
MPSSRGGRVLPAVRAASPKNGLSALKHVKTGYKVESRLRIPYPESGSFSRQRLLDQPASENRCIRHTSCRSSWMVTTVMTVMTIHVLHAGDGYLYLVRSVAAHDGHLAAGESLASYYTASGQPPGFRAGTGATSRFEQGARPGREWHSVGGRALVRRRRIAVGALQHSH